MVHTASQHTGNPPNIIPVRFGVYDNATGEQISRESSPYGFSFTSDDTIEFQQLFEKLHHYHLEGSAVGGILCGAVLSELVAKCLQELTERGEAGDWDTRVEKVKRLMDKDPCRRYEPDELAALAGFSEKYFRSMFKKQYGATPMEYQLKARMEYARFLLESGQTVKMVALSTGYPDPYSFSKQFKLKMGYPPNRLKMKKLLSPNG
jgi:AraC-like DNA-binding protein